MRRRWPLEKVFHNQTGERIYDDYGQPVPVGGTRVRICECYCEVPCKAYRCRGCRQKRPWCCGGSPDDRCDYCVTGIKAA